MNRKNSNFKSCSLKLTALIVLTTNLLPVYSNLPQRYDDFAPPEVRQCRDSMPDICSADQQRNIQSNTHLITVRKQAMTVADCECCLKLRVTE